ncbi:MAG: RNA polymerase sigma factor [Gammaproteobacteria bacterium]
MTLLASASGFRSTEVPSCAFLGAVSHARRPRRIWRKRPCCACTRNTRTTPAQNLPALTFSIARRVAVDQRRRQAWRARHETVDPFLDAVPYEGPGPDEAVIAEEAWRHVQKRLDELPVDCRTAFVRSSFHGLTYAQVAHHLGVSERMVAKHIARALRHCRASLGSS